MRRSPLLSFCAVLGLVIPTLGVIACSGPLDANDRMCTPKANVFCRCTDRSEGTKTCGDDGKSFTNCVCKGAPDDDDDGTKKKTDTQEEEERTTEPKSDDDTTRTDAGTPDANRPPTSDSGPPPLGTLCKELQKCCTELGQAGYLTDTCTGVVDARNEMGCHSAHLNYKNFGDCS